RSAERGECKAPRLILERAPPVESNPRPPPVAHPSLLIEVPTDAVESGVFLRWIVDLKDHDFGTAVAVEVRHCNAGSLVEPGEPVDFEPSAPASDLAVHREVGSDAVESLVGLSLVVGVEVVDVEHDEIRLAVAADVGYGDGRALIAPGDPVGNRLPSRPASGDVTERVELATDAKEASVGAGLDVLHLQGDEAQPRSSHVGHGYPASVFRGCPPRGTLAPGPPPAGDVALGIHRAAHAIESAIRPERRMIDPQNDQLRGAVVVEIGSGHV